MSFVLEQDTEAIRTLGIREKFRDQYWLKRDPIYKDRLRWRAHSFRHLVHLLPGQTILELGAGQGLFTKQLSAVCRDENSITSVTFSTDDSRPKKLSSSIEYIKASSMGMLAGRHFDFVIAHDLLDRRNCAWFLQNVYELLTPGGQLVLYESNPWNLVLRLRRFLSRFLGRKDPRRLLSRPDLYVLISQVGFIRVFSVYNDFVFAPLNRTLIWWLRNLSILLENAPGIRTLAGSILIHGQKPPRSVEQPKVSLFRYERFRKAVSVVIPCHNEEMNVESLVSKLQEFFGEYICEIILVDDNSRDATAAVIHRLSEMEPMIKPIFRSPPNGVGRALSDGLLAARGEYVLCIDCDFQHLLPQVADLFDSAAKDNDVVVGSRFSRYSVLLNYPFQKIVANRGFHLLAQILFLRRFRDLTNNLKLIRREVVENLQLTQPGFAINAEIGLQPLLMGYSVDEVPISWINRTPDMGVSSFRLVQAGGGYWQVLFRLWLKNTFGIGGKSYKKFARKASKQKDELKYN